VQQLLGLWNALDTRRRLIVGVATLGMFAAVLGLARIAAAPSMSLLYAGVDKDDERVIAAIDWLKSHFNLQENPNMGQEGLYYYLHTMAKALDAYDEDTLLLDDGTEVNWPKVLAERFVSLHKHPGFWVNENSRWMESNPYLVSAYSLLSLQYIYPKL